jgi:hypothetical protein
MNAPNVMQIAWVFERLLRHQRRGGCLRALVCKGFGLETNRWAYPILLKAGGDKICAILNEARKISHEVHREDTKSTKGNN